MRKQKFCVSVKFFAVFAAVFMCMNLAGCILDMDGWTSYYVAEYSTRKNFSPTYEFKFSKYNTFEIRMQKDGKTGIVCRGDYTGNPLKDGSVKIVVKEMRPNLEQEMTSIPNATSAVRHVIINDRELKFDDSELGIYDWEGRAFFLNDDYE